MYIFKNALKCIGRSFGRNLLIGIIVADEPTGNLDGETQDEIMAIFRELADAGKCVILVSHSPQVAKKCDVCYELKRAGKKKA